MPKIKAGAMMDSILRPTMQNMKNVMQSEAYALKQRAAMGVPASHDELKKFMARGEVMQGPLPKKKKPKQVYA